MLLVCSFVLRFNEGYAAWSVSHPHSHTHIHPSSGTPFDPLQVLFFFYFLFIYFITFFLACWATKKFTFKPQKKKDAKKRDGPHPTPAKPTSTPDAFSFRFQGVILTLFLSPLIKCLPGLLAAVLHNMKGFCTQRKGVK